MTKTPATKTTARRAKLPAAPQMPRVCAADGKLIAMIEADFQRAARS